MTIGAIILLIFIAFTIGMIPIYFFVNHDATAGIISLLICIIIFIGCVAGFYWYYNSTASGTRALKDQQSNFNKGLNREITITAEDGREIYHYKGKCDIETQDRYILFEGEDGLRRTIYWGITDTIIIEELN